MSSASVNRLNRYYGEGDLLLTLIFDSKCALDIDNRLLSAHEPRARSTLLTSSQSWGNGMPVYVGEPSTGRTPGVVSRHQLVASGCDAAGLHGFSEL